jgi:hypothetical protein
MTVWEKRIIETFVERYPASASAFLKESSADDAARPLRLRPERIFPDFDAAPPDERESFLEAAESLERQGLLSLQWVRHRKHEALTALICRDPELLFALAGRPSPKTTAREVRHLAQAAADAMIDCDADKNAVADSGFAAAARNFFAFLAENCTALDAERGIDTKAVHDLVRLTEALSRPEPRQGITVRALSISLYGDSKRLEALIDLCGPLLSRAERRGITVPDFSFLDRAFPETLVAGKITLLFGEDPAASGEKINVSGNVLGLTLGTILRVRRILPARGRVLMIENKETFFALSTFYPRSGETRHAPGADYTAMLYTAGHPNRAVRALVSCLAKSGFDFYHAGDLDPDGILILQELREIAGKPVQPVRMDGATFDRYAAYGRKLEPSMVRRIKFIDDTTRRIPGMEELITRIEKTGTGIEQEIIDYRE